MLKRYLLEYWGYDSDHVGETEILLKEVLVPNKTLNALLSENGNTHYEFIIADGQSFIIPAKYIVNLREQVETNSKYYICADSKTGGEER